MKLRLIKRITISLSFILFLFNGNAQTILNGLVESDLLLEKVNSPFQVTANLIIAQDVELTIEPGVRLAFDPGTSIVLRGRMTAIGNATDSIFFYSALNTPSVDDWDGIYVDNAFGASVRASYFNGLHANVLFEVTTNSSDTLLHLTNSKFAYNRFVISENDVVKTHLTYIKNCLFTNNFYGNDGASNNIILNSTFSYNAQALYNSTCQATVIDSCIFNGNTERGIAVNGLVTNSSFYDNEEAILLVHCENSIFENNDIFNNRIGISAFTVVGSNAPGLVQHNRICNNWEWNVKKTFGGDVNLAENCWCLNSSEDISETIFDIYEDSELGFVIFEPFVEGDSCNTLTTINDIEVVDFSVKVFPNPTYAKLQISINSIRPGTFSIELFDYSAKRKVAKQIGVSGNGTTSFDLSHLVAGFYFLIVKSENHSLSKKIIKL